MDDHSAAPRAATIKTVGAYEVKTHLAAILDQVERGTEFIITRHGKEVARVVPAEQQDKIRIDAAIQKLNELRKGSTLGGVSWKELRDEGRRFLD
jgi:prevent-host-death family protein